MPGREKCTKRIGKLKMFVKNRGSSGGQALRNIARIRSGPLRLAQGPRFEALRSRRVCRTSRVENVFHIHPFISFSLNDSI